MREIWEAPTLEDKRAAKAAQSELPPRDEIAAYHLADEQGLVGALVERAVYTSDERARIAKIAQTLAQAARDGRLAQGGVDGLMHEYGLTNEEGIMLMCLAEALLRIPDKATADALIAEKIGEGQWADHLGQSPSTFVNASTWGLMLTGKVVKLKDADGADPLSALKRLVARSGEPVIRNALRHAMKMMASQFVLGRTIDEALSRAAAYEARGYRFSYDMLGEEAMTQADADAYFSKYMEAVAAIGKSAPPLESVHRDVLMARPSLSVKLSAIHPRFEPGKEERLRAELLPKLIELARACADSGLMLTVDAEEQSRLDLTLGLFGEAFAHDRLAQWEGFGIAVQAYSKRAIPTLRWLKRLSNASEKRIPLRLVKGAYWDSEIKWAQMDGLNDYPVFTRKLHTDVSYLAAMRFVLSDPAAFFPQFATHNAHSVAAACVSAGKTPFEFQRLHGMGMALYDEVVAAEKLGKPCRIYAPVGGHEDLLAYLIRRLLENGANTSFVNRLADDAAPLEDIIRDPAQSAQLEREMTRHAAAPGLPHPRDIFLPERKAAAAVALYEPFVRTKLEPQIAEALKEEFAVGPIVTGEALIGYALTGGDAGLAQGDEAQLILCPHDRRQRLGSVRHASVEDIDAAMTAASAAAPGWDRFGADERAACLERTADLMERDWVRLCAVIVREAGKTLDNAQGDIREAVDFLRYYASQARALMGEPRSFQSPTGERNIMSLHGRGPFVCIAPWNFPLAIFTGQIAAALGAGNPVLAKPAAQTPLTAFLAVQLFLEAGVPPDVLHLLPGGGDVGAALVNDPRIAGVAFTGSNDTAWAIQSALAKRRGPLIPFIAETGGINAMIVDSSALPEQVVRDLVRSAFDSAGQRCSAARVVFLQDDIADKTIDMLIGATAALDLGDPLDYATDIGPVIDEAAHEMLDAHKFKMQGIGRELYNAPVPNHCVAGTYVSPAIYEIDHLGLLEREVFGPILHVIRFAAGELHEVCDEINASGYGLTLGLHSRIDAVADYVAAHVRIGNLYVNRDQIGAVVGVQPFGGEGLSGTGPKAGGPHYLLRFVTERVRTTDVTATGGNAQLLGMPILDKK